MRIEIVIDELVLHGFDPRSRDAIGDAVRMELARLISDERSSLGNALTKFEHLHVDAVNAATVTLGHRASAASTGNHIARAVHGALPRPQAPTVSSASGVLSSGARPS